MENKIEETYKGKKIILNVNGNKKEIDLSIDNHHIHVMKLKDKLSSHYLPYMEFTNPIDLAKAIVDNIPEYSQKSWGNFNDCKKKY